MKRRGLTLLLAAVAALALLWWLPAPAALWQRALAVPAPVWLLAALGMAASYGLRAARLRDEWTPRVPAAHWREALHITLLHSAAINVLPLRAGELGYPWLLQRRWGIALGESAASLFWLRVQDAVVLAAWGFAVFGPGSGAAGAAWRGALMLALLLVLALGSAALARRATQALGLSLAASATGGNAAQKLLHRLLAAAQGSRPRGWLWASANWTIKLAALALLLHALCEISAPAALAGALAGEGAAVLPLQAPAGFGTYEAGVWLGARAAGAAAAEPSAVLGAAFTAHCFVIASSIIGALLSQLLQGAQRTPHKVPQ